MKTLKFTISIFVIAFIVCINKVDGQTVQVYATAKFDGLTAWCLNRPISGQWTYHITYHIDKKTGYADRGHGNILHADIWDTETGEKYIVVDTGNDNLGQSWGFWNDVNNQSGGFIYDLEPNFIPVGELPLEGSNVWATFKYISKGKIYRISSLVQFHINANGDLTGEVNKYYEDCN